MDTKEKKNEPLKDERIDKKENRPESSDKEHGLRELLEKNLKWSQIIYEQTRRLNRRLFWNSVFSWIKLTIIIAPLILGVWYFWPTLKNVQQQYTELLNLVGGAKSSIDSGKLQMDKSMMDKILKILPLNTGAEEQLKAMMK